MTGRYTRGRARLAVCAVLVVSALAAAACTGHPTSAPPTSTAPSSIGGEPPAPREAHPNHDTLAAALPSATDLAWLPTDADATHDSDLTDQLVFVGCSAAPHTVPTRRASATNIAFHESGERLVKITYYDVDSIDDATVFMSGMRAFLRCPNQGRPVSVSLLPLATPTRCDDTIALRTRQPQSETIDAWCRVGNLVAWIHLDPERGLAPTDAQGIGTIDSVGAHLGALFA